MSVLRNVKESIVFTKKDSLEEETIDPSEKFVLIMSIACTAWNPDEKR